MKILPINTNLNSTNTNKNTLNKAQYKQSFGMKVSGELELKVNLWAQKLANKLAFWSKNDNVDPNLVDLIENIIPAIKAHKSNARVSFTDYQDGRVSWTSFPVNMKSGFKRVSLDIKKYREMLMPDEIISDHSLLTGKAQF